MIVALYNNWKKSMVQSSDIELLKANGRYSMIFLKTENLFSDKSLSDWERELSENNFVRIHKSYIVNLSYIISTGTTIVLKNGTIVPLARRRKKEFEQKYKHYLMQQP